MSAPDVLSVGGVKVAGVCACLPSGSVDNAGSLRGVYGEKAEDIVKATGIRRRRIAAPGTAPVDLCCRAAERLMARLGIAPDGIGAVISVSFTQPVRMPAAACVAQARLGLPEGALAFDISLACSGYPYGLYVAALLARETGRKVLLLDGDVQSAFTGGDDAATLPVLADGGSATVVVPDAAAAPWRFAFRTDGAKGDALRLGDSGRIAMDGFGVFRYVAMEVAPFLRGFLTATATDPAALGCFAPHQANVYMVRELAKAVKVPDGKTWISADEIGNLSSASVPVTLARVGAANERRDRLTLLAGFGGGLSASAALLTLNADTVFENVDYGD